jgi:hypothetical protein
VKGWRGSQPLFSLQPSLLWKSPRNSHSLFASNPVFWFTMQIAMIIGFFTSYPANEWLVRKGFKEEMPADPRAAVALDNKKSRAVHERAWSDLPGLE